jgi:2-polyprenyl-6-methoxyphenol 4-hydroxylase
VSAAATDYDVVIAGGGMVGASLALQLSKHSGGQLKLLIVESFPIPAAATEPPSKSPAVPSYNPSFDARSTALAYSSRLILDGLGLWPSLSQHIADISTIHVSERGRLGSTTMHQQAVDWPALGYVVENAWLGKVLMASLRQQPNVAFMAPASVADIKPRRQQVELLIDQADQRHKLSAQLAIIADGANSGLRQQLGIQTRVVDYQQSALIANVSFKKPHLGCAYERFTRQGPMALLPLTDDESGQPRSALVWSMPPQQARELSECEPAVFLAALQQRFGYRQGAFTRIGERFSYPLQRLEAIEQVRSGVVVMGNAAHSIHPVAGQGFNLALRDCARLSKLLVAAHQRQQPLGELALLQQYCQQQQFDQRKTIEFSDQLPGLFSRPQLAISLLRNLGLGLLDLTPAAKTQFIYHAAGMHDGAAID